MPKVCRRKKRLLEKLQSFQEFRVHQLKAAQYEFFEHWYYTAIRELLEIVPFNEKYKEFGSLLEPSVSASEVFKAVKVLEKLGLIEKNENGYWEKTERLLSTGYEAPTKAVGSYILKTLDLAKKALGRVPREERNISWATFSISEDSFKKIQDEIRSFRLKILQLASQDPNPERVYHLGINFFPFSKSRKGKERL
ncbi:DUF4423 domain-containing protein [Chitinispirillales bacterium ANBcel5]|uniref:DUF4423 domain-containing protein n=1 Tax=Cellulosispirillum alkaliphilum TaxID=3039283 RepID=UPI002A54AC1E|nr:DUF4423 domain-containing protein [Chitinispirillales bacterium ANBcel5]